LLLTTYQQKLLKYAGYGVLASSLIVSGMLAYKYKVQKGKEGANFTVLSQECKSALPPEGMVELMSLGCPHCLNMESYLVGFKIHHLQTVFDKNNEEMALFVYALEHQNKTNALKDAFIKVQKDKGVYLRGSDNMAEFAKEHEINLPNLISDMESKAAYDVVTHTLAIQKACMVTSVPMLYSNGKATSPTLAGGYKEAAYVLFGL